MNVDLKAICIAVCDIARAAGNFMVNERKVFSLDKVETKGTNDFVSYVDKKAEELIVKQLLPLIPEAGFITEEKTIDQNKDTEYTWVIDPLDGTTNYVHGLSPYAVSIALMHNNNPVVGVVYVAAEKECFYAWKGGGAYLNGEPLRTSATKDIKDSILITGFPYKIGEKVNNYMAIMNHLTFNSHGVRRFGSAAADIVYVAAGRAEIFYQTDLSPWDVAAGAIIAECAGATLTDFKGGDNYIFGKSILVTANNELNKKMRELLQDFFPDQE